MRNEQIRIYQVTSRLTGFTTTQSAIDSDAAKNKALVLGKFPGHSQSDLITKLVFTSKNK